MTLSSRVVALALLGIIPIALWPSGSTVRWWLLLVLVLIALDIATTPSAKALTFARSTPGRVRLGESTRSDLLVTNTGSRAVRGLLRDAWQPSAGAMNGVHELSVGRGERIRLSTTLAPTRRGDLRADRVTVRLRGPLGPGVYTMMEVVFGCPWPARSSMPLRSGFCPSARENGSTQCSRFERS